MSFCSRIPNGHRGDSEEAAPSVDFEAIAEHSRSHCGQELMLVSNGYLVECPQNVIPSLVWLERAKQRKDFIRDILAETPGRHIKFSRSASEGKVSMTRLNSPARDRDSVSRVVKCGAKVINGIPDNLFHARRQRSDQLAFAHMITMGVADQAQPHRRMDQLREKHRPQFQAQ